MSDQSASLPLDEPRPARPFAKKLRRLWERHRLLGALGLCALPTLTQVLFDVGRRSERLLGFSGVHWLTYGAAVVESLFVFGSLLLAAGCVRHRASLVYAALFLLMFMLTLGGQAYFFEQYNAYLNTDVSVFASNLMESVVSQFLADLPNYLRTNLPALGFGLAFLLLVRRVMCPEPRVATWVLRLAAVPLLLSFFIPTQHRQIQASTPDVLYLNALGGLLKTHLGLTEQAGQLRPRARESRPVPPLTPRAAHRDNVILIQLESVRFDAVCNEYHPDCRHTPATNALFPKRFPLNQLRSIASTTAMASAALWGGLSVTATRDQLHTQPLLFDYARAAGYRTAYFTAQNLLFGNARLWVKNLGVDRTFSATDVDPDCDLDLGARENLVATRLIEELDRLPEPFLMVVQLSNVHFPYYVDRSLPQPFQPADLSRAQKDRRQFFNHYLNAVHQQDLHLARFLRHLMASPKGERTIVVSTSDHAESFQEHGTGGHTFSVMDEEIHVPAWIVVPDGHLGPEQEEALRAHKNLPVTQLDLPVTILDLLGLWDEPGLGPFRAHMFGHSLVRPPAAREPVPISNCTGVWSCAFENWGILDGFMKVEAREWDGDWRCWDLERDPKELFDLTRSGCPELVELAEKTFGRLPGPSRD